MCSSDLGSATIYFSYDKIFAVIVRNYYGKKRISKKLIRKFIREATINYVNEHSKVNVKDLELG